MFAESFFFTVAIKAKFVEMHSHSSKIKCFGRHSGAGKTLNLHISFFFFSIDKTHDNVFVFLAEKKIKKKKAYVLLFIDAIHHINRFQGNITLLATRASERNKKQSSKSFSVSSVFSFCFPCT